MKIQERCVTHNRANTKQKKEHNTEYRKGEYQTWRENFSPLGPTKQLVSSKMYNVQTDNEKDRKRKSWTMCLKSPNYSLVNIVKGSLETKKVH
jgi:hypothetical protein